MNKHKEIMDRLKSEGKVRVLNTKENMDAIEELNERCRKTHDEYIYKNFMSELSARNIIIK